LQEKVHTDLNFGAIPPFLPFIVRPILGTFCNFMTSTHKKSLVGNFELMETALSEATPWFAGEKIELADFLLSFPMDMAEQRK
jgi:hypothetical protein